MSAEPQIEIHGESIDQGFLLMVESAVIHGAVFSHDGLLLVVPIHANRDALDLFEQQPLTTALSLEWLRLHAAERGYV